MILRLSFEGRELVSPLLRETSLRFVQILYKLTQSIQKSRLNRPDFSKSPPTELIHPSSIASTSSGATIKAILDYSFPTISNVAMGPNILSGKEEFVLKPTLITMVQASPFHGKPSEDANAHLQNFLEICNTISIRGVSQDAIRL